MRLNHTARREKASRGKAQDDEDEDDERKASIAPDMGHVTTFVWKA